MPATVKRISAVPAPDTSRSAVAGISYHAWLQSLKRQHMARVLTHTGHVMPAAMVTNDTPQYVFIGKLKFRRGDGWQVARNASKCYRMRLRLVRDEKDPQ